MKVELHPACMWDCPTCGTENFARIVSEHADIGDDENGDEVDGYLCAPPERVTCRDCKAEFESDLPRPEDGEEKPK